MKLIIAGGRHYLFTHYDLARLMDLLPDVTEVVSGACPTGADPSGERWATEHGIPVKMFPADWERFRRGAGPYRNAAMAAYADAVVLFPGGAGTQSMHDEAVKAGIKIYDWRGTP